MSILKQPFSVQENGCPFSKKKYEVSERVLVTSEYVLKQNKSHRETILIVRTMK